MSEISNDLICSMGLAKIIDSNDIELLREKLSEVEEFMKSQDVVDVPIKHAFSKGVYAREMTVKKGSMVVGKIHKFENMNILSQGEVSVISIDGCMRVKAPFTFVASPGSKRLFYMHEDTVWTTIHGTEETDLDKIEDIFIAKDYNELEQIYHTEHEILGGS
jgi:hypothetical protein